MDYRYEYDAQGHMTVMATTRDTNLNPATRTWSRGVVTEYGCNALAQLVDINYSDTTPDVTYTYDRLGRQLSAIAAGVSTNLYAYSTNTLDLVSEARNGVVINRSRDAFGRESGIAPLPAMLGRAIMSRIAT